MSTYKRRMIIFAVGIVIVLGLFIYGITSHKNIDSLPSLEQVAQMADEAELNSYITHFTKPELKVVWGEPNESSTMEDVWFIDDSTKLIVNYHNNDDKVAVCSIVRVDKTNGNKMEICIDNIFYVNTEIEVPIEPDESTIEHVEIPVGGGSTIKAFAKIHDNNEDYLVCLIGDEWFKFIAE